MSEDEKNKQTIEEMIDRLGLSAVTSLIASVCYSKVDGTATEVWDKLGDHFSRTAAAIHHSDVFPAKVRL